MRQARPYVWSGEYWGLPSPAGAGLGRGRAGPGWLLPKINRTFLDSAYICSYDLEHGYGEGEGTTTANELSGAQLAELCIEQRRQIDLLEIQFSITAARFAATDEYNEQGSRSEGQSRHRR